jgi:hypothetical protein
MAGTEETQVPVTSPGMPSFIPIKPTMGGLEQTGKESYATWTGSPRRWMKVERAHEAMMGRGVMFGEIVGEVVGAFAPVDEKLTLLYAVADPIKSHVDCFGAALFDCVVGNTSCADIVCLNGRGRLWVSHVDESSAKPGCIFGVVEESAEFSLGGGRQYHAHESARCVNAAVDWWWCGCWWRNDRLEDASEIRQVCACVVTDW